jgi:hypothetical protein
MTSAQELAANLGKRALLTVSGSALSFEVEILDARKRYGNLDYKVRPIAGQGETWHQSHALTILDIPATV